MKIKSPSPNLLQITTHIGSNQRGQSSVFVALTAVVFIAFLAFVANIGQMVHDKILTQAVADATALTAANIQAVGMNEIADLNAEIHKLVDECEREFANTNYDFAPAQGWATYNYYNTQIKYLHMLQDEANEDFAQMADEAAQKIVDFHNDMYKQIHPQVDTSTSKNLPPVEKWTLEQIMGESSPKEKLGDLLPAKENLKLYWTEYFLTGYPTSSIFAGTFTHHRDGVVVSPILYNLPVPGYGEIERHHKLSPDTNVYYRVRLKRKPVLALVDMEKYGFSVNIPEITTYSQAQPNKGNIEELTPDYEARLAPLWQTYPNETDDEEYLSLVNEFKH